MTLKDQIAADLAAVFYATDDFADAGTYTPVGGSPVACTVLVNHDVLIQADGYDVSVATLGTTISAMVAEVGTPARGDTIALASGTTYTVQRIERYSEDGLEVTAVVR